jgi:hypothetical protein
MSCGQEVIIVADHTKFGRLALARLCGLDEVQRVVTDAGLSLEYHGVLERAGVELHLADDRPQTDMRNGDSGGPARALGIGKPA